MRCKAAALLRTLSLTICALVTYLKARLFPIKPLDAELAEIIETVWAAEVMWRLEDRVEASIRYGTKTSD
jgi:uncharacterized paraquat-inducible protein A